MKYLVISLLTCFLIVGLISLAIVSAAEASEVKISMKIYNKTIEITKSDKFGEASKEFNFEVKNNSVVQKTVDWSFWSSINDSIVSIDLFQENKNLNTKLSECNERKGYYAGQVTTWENTCNNASACTKELSNCKTELTNKNGEISSKSQKITELETDAEGTSNQKYFWLIGGVIAGIFGWRFWKGEIGRTAKDKSEDEFSRTQAG